MSASELSDLELAALISSKICHDVIGPVGAIYNGLEVLDEDEDEESREFALHEIRSFTRQASAKLQFARFAFGAAGGAGAVVDLNVAREISKGFVENAKHRLVWTVPAGHLDKDRAKLLLNMIASAVSALPRGGEMTVSLEGEFAWPTFVIRCSGEGARAPQALAEFIEGPRASGVDALTIQAYYTCRLAASCEMSLAVRPAGGDIVLTARPR